MNKPLRTAAGRDLMARKTSGLLVDVLKRINTDLDASLTEQEQRRRRDRRADHSQRGGDGMSDTFEAKRRIAVMEERLAAYRTQAKQQSAAGLNIARAVTDGLTIATERDLEEERLLFVQMGQADA